MSRFNLSIDERLLVLRNRRVILDVDLAELYGVRVNALNAMVRNHPEFFPVDFVFALTCAELNTAMEQRSHSQQLAEAASFAFTEHGVLMLATLFKNAAAVRVSIEVARAFVRLREVWHTLRELSHRIDAMEHQVVSAQCA